ncbi:MAG: RNA 3'-terminal phosphate cyclase [Methanomassiliicoccales archaeon]|nr:RNA 3'-terminal phosphate cyclase [Methanomassiliicoccales archaeon]
MIELDGSQGEGGGQIVRTALSLSAITGEPFRISSIRAGRPEPGLRPQHLAGVKLMQSICSADVQGAEVGSTCLEFHPGIVLGGSYVLDVGTAGSLTLLMQSVLPALVLSPVHTELVLTGGTDVRWSPPVDHHGNVLFPLLRRMGAKLDMTVERRGFYPKGDGHMRLTVQGGPLRPLHLTDRGELLRLSGTAYVQGLSEKVAERMAASARKDLPDAEVRKEVTNGRSIGAGISLYAEYANSLLGWSCLGERGMPAEDVGHEAAAGLLREIAAGGTLDVHTADQILPYMALAGGGSFSVREVSGHLATQMAIVPRFLPVRFTVDEGAPVSISISRT